MTSENSEEIKEVTDFVASALPVKSLPSEKNTINLTGETFSNKPLTLVNILQGYAPPPSAKNQQFTDKDSVQTPMAFNESLFRGRQTKRFRGGRGYGGGYMRKPRGEYRGRRYYSPY